MSSKFKYVTDNVADLLPLEEIPLKIFTMMNGENMLDKSIKHYGVVMFKNKNSLHMPIVTSDHFWEFDLHRNGNCAKL